MKTLERVLGECETAGEQDVAFVAWHLRQAIFGHDARPQRLHNIVQWLADEVNDPRAKQILVEASHSLFRDAYDA